MVCYAHVYRLIISSEMKNSHCFRTPHAVQVYSAARHLWDAPIFESDSFVVLPTVAPLVEGWLLVVPRTRVLCFAQLGTLLISELERFLAEIVPIVEINYGPVSAFEHGPSKKASPIGCGVDYAHLHLVPVQFDLERGAREMEPNIEWKRINSLADLRNQIGLGDDYWFVQQPYGLGRCHLGRCSYGEPPNQLFRKVIATGLGCPEAFDWKQTLGSDKIAATVERLAQHVVCA